MRVFGILIFAVAVLFNSTVCPDHELPRQERRHASSGVRVPVENVFRLTARQFNGIYYVEEDFGSLIPLHDTVAFVERGSIVFGRRVGTENHALLDREGHVILLDKWIIREASDEEIREFNIVKPVLRPLSPLPSPRPQPRPQRSPQPSPQSAPQRSPLPSTSSSKTSPPPIRRLYRPRAGIPSMKHFFI